LQAIGDYLSEIDCAEHWDRIRPILKGAKVLQPLRRMVLIADLVTSEEAPEELSVEVVSDLSTSVVLGILGAYKPAMMALRSATENSVRVLIASDRKVEWNPLDIRRMFRAAISAATTVDKKAVELVEAARVQYRWLCSFVHTGGKEQMVLEGRLRQVPKFDAAKLAEVLMATASAAHFATNVLFIAHAPKIRGAHAESRDFVLDGVLKRIKARK